MHITIAGGGMVGGGLAKRLVDAKHDVVIIDIDPAVCEELYSDSGAVTVNGSATDLDVLESSGLQKSDVAVAVLDNDADNLAFALLAKNYNVKQILVKMNNPKYEQVYRSLGIKNIARATDLLTDQLLVSIETPELRKLIGFGEIEICLVDISSESKISNYSIKELRKLKGFPEEIIITCVYLDETKNLIIPHAETKINPKDRIFVCGNRKDIKKVAALVC